MKLKHLVVAFGAIGLSFVVPSFGQSYAITNARIVTVSGAPIEKGTVVVRDGLIQAVGSDIKTPADAQVFDGTGLTVYPGFFDTLTTLGLQTPVPAPARTPGGGGGPQAVTSSAAPSNSNYPSGLRPEALAADDLKA